MNVDKIKGLLKSKVFWFNSLTLVVEGAGLLVGIVPPGTVATAVALANIGLRLLTTTSLEDKVKRDE